MFSTEKILLVFGNDKGIVFGLTKNLYCLDLEVSS